MKVPEMANNISAYQAINKSDAFADYSSAFHAFLHTNPNVVSRAVLAERKGFHDQDHEKGSIVSSPSENPSDWGNMYHPLYGNCITYSPSNFSGAAKFVKMVIDLNEAYPPRPPKPTTTTASTTTTTTTTTTPKPMTVTAIYYNKETGENRTEIFIIPPLMVKEAQTEKPDIFGMQVGFAPILFAPGMALPYGLIDRQQTNRRFEKGFGQFMVVNNNRTMYLYHNLKIDLFQVAVYKKGDFSKTHRLVRVDHSANEYFTFEMEVFDKEM